MISTDPTVELGWKAVRASPYNDAERLRLADALDELSDPEPCPACSGYADDPCPRCDGKKLYEQYSNNAFVTVACPECRDHIPGKFPPGCYPERSPASGRHEGGWTNCKTCNGGGHSEAIQQPGRIRGMLAARAELMRVQVTLDRHEPCPECEKAHARHTGSGRGICHGKAGLLIAQNRLTVTNFDRWRAGLPCERCGIWLNRGMPADSHCPVCDGTGDGGGLKSKFSYTNTDPNDETRAWGERELVRVTYERGGVVLTVPRLDVGVEIKRFQIYPRDGNGPAEYEYSVAVSRWLAAVAKCHPDVTQVVALDKSPLKLVSTKAYRWSLVPSGDPFFGLPRPIIDRLPTEKACECRINYVDYENEADAKTALAYAVARFAYGE